MLIVFWKCCVPSYYSFCSLHVSPLPHWVNLVWEGRGCKEGGNLIFFHPCNFDLDLYFYTSFLTWLNSCIFFAWIAVGCQQVEVSSLSSVLCFIVLASKLVLGSIHCGLGFVDIISSYLLVPRCSIIPYLLMESPEYLAFFEYLNMEFCSIFDMHIVQSWCCLNLRFVRVVSDGLCITTTKCCSL